MTERIINIVRGPIHSSEWPDWDEQEDGFGLRYNQGYILVVQLQDERGVVEVEELVFEEFDDAMEVVNHFTDQIVTLDWDDSDE